MSLELRRVVGLPEFVFDRVAGWKAQAERNGFEVVDFGIGSPDRPAPPPVVERAVTALRDPATHGYPVSAGIPELRSALAAWYRRRYDVVLDPDAQVLVTWGASEAMTHLPWVLLEPGDACLVPSPCYPIHHYAVLFSGAKPVPVEIDPRGDVAAALERALAGAQDGGAGARPRAAVLSFPHNPTTRCVELADLERLVAVARAHDLVLVHDFAYAEIGFDGYRPPSVLQVPGAADLAVELVSLSKSHNMAGFRLGFAAGNAEVVGALRRLKSFLDYGVSTPVQLAGLAAFEDCDAFGAGMAAVYQARRDRLCDGLAACGWPVARPRGSMFVWAPVPGRFAAAGSLAFARHLLEAAHIAVSPGVGFGPAGDGHVRFSLVQDDARIDQALEGIAHALVEPLVGRAG